jgi:hypothetical protein
MLSALTGLLLGAAPVAAFLLERNLRKAAWFATSTVPALAWYSFVSKNTPKGRHSGKRPSRPKGER